MNCSWFNLVSMKSFHHHKPFSSRSIVLTIKIECIRCQEICLLIHVHMLKQVKHYLGLILTLPYINTITPNNGKINFVIFCDGLNACQCLSEAGVFVSSLVTHWTGNSPGRKVSHTLNYFHPAKLTKIKGENIIYQQKISGQIQQRTKTDIQIPDAHGGALIASLVCEKY